MRSILLATAAACIATPALADPCKAIPDKGPMPSYLHRGATFSGSVPYIVDGDGICVARGPSPGEWIEVRLADFYAPELREQGGPAAKAALERLVAGRRVSCVAQHRTHDRVAAVCKVDGIPLGDRMRQAGVKEGGNGRRP
jgi:micrococcal nuclease